MAKWLSALGTTGVISQCRQWLAVYVLVMRRLLLEGSRLGLITFCRRVDIVQKVVLEGHYVLRRRAASLEGSGLRVITFCESVHSIWKVVGGERLRYVRGWTLFGG